MTQPELGQKIAALRKAKGFTQEEVCSACGINIRSLQRIESGEVNPRVYTLKLISNALDYDFWSSTTANRTTGPQSFWKRNFINTPDDLTMAAHAKWGWIGGVLYFLMTIPDVILGTFRYSQDLNMPMKGLYILSSLVVILSAFLFYRAFASLGRRHNQSILSVSAIMIMLLTLVLYGYEIISINVTPIPPEIIGVLHLLTFGCTSILFGIGLSRIESKEGTTAKVAAILEVVSGVSFILIITALIGMITILPAIIVEIILLHKVHRSYQEETIAVTWAS